MARIWTDEEIQFLKFAYPNKDFTSEEIFKSFEGKTPAQIRSKARDIGVKRYKEEVAEGFKRCTRCKTILPLDHFYEEKGNKLGRSSMCRVCNVKRNKEYLMKKRKSTKPTNNEQPTNNEEIILHKTCKKCGETKSYKEFHENKNMKDGRLNTCKDCRSKENRVRYIKGGY